MGAGGQGFRREGGLSKGASKRMSVARDWHDKVSQAQYDIVLEEDVWVEMRDGVRLAVDVYRPKGEGRFPALLSLSIYGKLSQKLPTNPVFQPSDYISGTGGHECGEQNYFVPRGYVHVIPDVRGVGKSEGEFSSDLAHDGYDLIEWMARQDWCNGNVGMLGMSQFAHAQFRLAAERPPHLKAICPFEGRTDAYRHHYYHGGILNYLFANSYSRLLPIRSKTQAASLKEFSTEQLQAKVRELHKNPDILCLPYLCMAAATPEMNPLMFDLLMHPHDGEFYRRQSSASRFKEISIPVLLGARWNGAVLHLPGAFDAYADIATPEEKKRLMIVPSDNYGGMDRPFHEIQDVVLRFYDHWLKGLDTGMMDEPPMLFFVQGINTWRYEREFPLAATQWEKFYLHGNGTLSLEAPRADEEPQVFESNPWANPTQGFSRADTISKADPVPKVTYEFGPLAQNLEITGPIALYWHAAIESRGVLANDPAHAGLTLLEPLNNDTDWYLKLFDVDVDGSFRCVTEGWLKASHYEIDPECSKPYQPYHPHTGNRTIAPGETILYASDMRMTCNVFLAGHKIRLEISGQDQVQALWYHVPHMAHVKHTIFSTDVKPSYLLLPVIPQAYSGAGEPECAPEGPFRIAKYQRA